MGHFGTLRFRLTYSEVLPFLPRLMVLTEEQPFSQLVLLRLEMFAADVKEKFSAKLEWIVAFLMR